MMFFFAFSIMLLLGWWVQGVSWPALSSGTHPWSAFRHKYTESVTLEGAAFLFHVNLASWQRFLEGGLVACFFVGVVVQRRDQR